MNQPSEDYPEIEKSLLNYGLPDLATINIINSEELYKFERMLKNMLLNFEPRLSSVEISFPEKLNNTDRSLRFRISAMLNVDPLPEKIVFKSVFEPQTRKIEVEEVSHG